MLSKKYGEIDTKHLFDGISDKDIEDNLETAENTIQTNIDRGMLSKNALPKLPNLRDGLALSYAAANKGNSKAATRAREAAYMESVGSLVDKVKNGLSYELPKMENAVLKTNEKPKVTNLLGDPNTKPEIEDFLMKISLSYENKEQNSDNPLLDTDVSWKSKALGDSKKADEATKEEPKNEFDYSNETSSKLDRYEPADIAKDWLLPSFDILDVIGNLKDKGEGRDYASAIVDVARNNLTIFDTAKDAARSVWKAGSEWYLRPRGWDISADMLEHSLQEKPKDVVFYEDSNVVKKIKGDNEFMTHLDEIVYKVENKIPLTKEDKYHNFNEGDLLYSIHGCSLEIDDIKYNADGTKDISVHLSDTYDYTKIWTAMGDNGISLATVANDAGTISSKLDAINQYEVDIYFTIRR